MQPVVSIIMPVYNTGPYLREAIDSVLAQTCQDWELIVVDDGSTDDSPAILASYTDSRIRIIRQPNAGQSVARNTAMDVASGEYVYFIDSDDAIEPTLIEECLKAIGDSDFIFFNADTIGAEASPWQTYHMATLFDEKPLSGAAVLDEAMERYHWRCVVWLLFIRRSYIRSISLSFFPGIIHEDELYSGALFAQARQCRPLHRTLVHHRIREGSTMGHSFSLRNVRSYAIACHRLELIGHPSTKRLAHYTMRSILRTGKQLSISDKVRALCILLRYRVLHLCRG